MKNIKFIIFLIFTILFIYFIFPYIFNFLMNTPSPFGYVTNETKGAWIGYIGSAMGGVITLIGVILTWMYTEKVREKTFSDNLKLTNEQLRLEMLPYLIFEINQKENFEDLNLNSWVILDIGKDGSENIHVFISISNRGISVAKKVKVQIIIDDVFDHGQLELCKGIIQVNETKFSGFVLRCNKDYVLNSINGNVDITMIFFYEDILGNCYTQKYSGDIQFVYCNNEKTDDLCINFSTFEEPKLTKIRYYYISEEDISKKEKEKKAIKEANDLLNKINYFKRKEELDQILNTFNVTYYNPKMDKLIGLIKNKGKSQGSRGEGLVRFEVLSDGIVYLRMEGGFSFGEKELSYSYALKTDLDNKVVTFTQFNIINRSKITLIELLKIKLMFLNKKIKC